MVRIFGSLALLATCLLAINLIFALQADTSHADFAQGLSDLNVLYEQLHFLQSQSRIPEGSLDRVQREIDINYERFQPVQKTASFHFLFLTATALVTLLVDSLTITYLIGTGRWCKEVVDTYQLDEDLSKSATIGKRRAFPWAMGGVAIVLVLAALGAAANPGVTLGSSTSIWIRAYQIAAVGATVASAFAFYRQFGYLRANYRIIQEILRRVAQIRRERGLEVES